MGTPAASNLAWGSKAYWALSVPYLTTPQAATPSMGSSAEVNTCWILPESHYPFLLSNGIHFPFPEDWGRSGYPWPVEVSTGHELSQLVNLFPRPQGPGGAWPFISPIKWNSCLECWEKAIPPLLDTRCVEVRPPLCPVSHHDRSQVEEVNAWKRVQQVNGVQDPNSSKTSRWFQTWGLYGF